MNLTKKYLSVALSCAAWSTTALATDGYIMTGYGVKSQGMGGVGIAFPQDGLASAYNPAGIGLVDDQLNLGMSYFRPNRGATITGNNVPGFNGSYDGNGVHGFFIPEVGFVKRLSNTLSVGVAMYANGGLNTDYNNNPFKAFGSTGKLGVNLEQTFVKPALAFKVNEAHTVGVGVNMLFQRFTAKGLQAFSSFSSDPNHFTNNDHSYSAGVGLHLGWIGKLTDNFSLGASWASRVFSSKFGGYSGLFADNGNFDAPEVFGIGAAFKATPQLTLAADIERINYAGIASVGNPLSNLFAGDLLGSRNGPGFGWRNITVVKVGASYDIDPNWTVRVGYNHSGNVIPADQTLFNILAPAVVKHHLHIGGTWRSASYGEWSAFYAHSFGNELEGSNSIPANFGGGNANLRLRQNVFGVAYTWKL